MIKGKGKQKIYFFIGDILSLINKIIPKKKNKILFFSSNSITDNSKALLDYLIDNKYDSKYSIVCCAKNLDNYTYNNNLILSYFTPLKAVLHIFTSKYIFFHGEIIAIKPSKSQISVNLWHGTPLKRFNKTADKLSDYKYNFFTYLLASSEYFQPIMRDCFDCNLNQVKILGHPRNDLLFESTDILNKLSIDKSKFNKIFLWMPTFRVSKDNYIIDSDINTQTGLPIYHSKADLLNLEKYLSKINSLLLIKLHPAQNLDFINVDTLSHIILLKNEDIENTGYHLYNLVAMCDSLITDYSSIYFDYLLLNRPIAFTVDDIESYIKNRGFVIENPYDLMPGTKIKNIDEFKHYIDLISTKGNDSYFNERKKVNDIANKYQDNNNCKRIVEFVQL